MDETKTSTPATTKKPLKSLKSNPDTKKKVWSKLKSGIYGWEPGTGQHVAKSTSANKTQKYDIYFNVGKSTQIAEEKPDFSAKSVPYLQLSYLCIFVTAL